MTKIEFTHKGWFGLCPVYMSKPFSGCPEIEPIYPFTDWLMDFSAFVYGLCFKMAGALNPEFEPLWPFTRITELKEPIQAEYEDE